jgi:hypothetical protein
VSLILLLRWPSPKQCITLSPLALRLHACAFFWGVGKPNEAIIGISEIRWCLKCEHHQSQPQRWPSPKDNILGFHACQAKKKKKDNHAKKDRNMFQIWSSTKHFTILVSRAHLSDACACTLVCWRPKVTIIKVLKVPAISAYPCSDSMQGTIKSCCTDYPVQTDACESTTAWEGLRWRQSWFSYIHVVSAI